ncbi:EamA family transporter [Vibrio sp. HN007]|uniref:EamA family transporter n=1 Tax=Vibrio iocasae TaxID=3098914 RepID=UPI0035D506D5
MNIIYMTVLTALAPIIWGSTYYLTTEFLPPGQPFLAAAIRCLPAGIFLLAIFWERVNSASFKRLFILSILNISLFQSMLFISAYNLPGGLASLIGSLQPAIVAFLAFVFKNETLSKTKIFMFFTALIGMSLIFVQNSIQWDLLGVIAALIGAISMSFGTFLSRKWSSNINLYAFTGYQLVLGGIILLCISPLYDTYPTNLEAKNVYGYAYLVVFGAIISYSIWFNGVKKLPLSVASSLGFLSPITAIIIGWVALNQSLTLTQLAGVGLVLYSLCKIVSPTKPDTPKIVATKLHKNTFD